MVSFLLYEAFGVALAPFVVCGASVSSSCLCFGLLLLNPSYGLLLVVFIRNFVLCGLVLASTFYAFAYLSKDLWFCCYIPLHY